MSCRTVVRSAQGRWATRESSYPTTETSPGTSTPWARNVVSSPRAQRSLKATTPVGSAGSPRRWSASIASAAARPLVLGEAAHDQPRLERPGLGGLQRAPVAPSSLGAARGPAALHAGDVAVPEPEQVPGGEQAAGDVVGPHHVGRRTWRRCGPSPPAAPARRGRPAPPSTARSPPAPGPRSGRTAGRRRRPSRPGRGRSRSARSRSRRRRPRRRAPRRPRRGTRGAGRRPPDQPGAAAAEQPCPVVGARSRAARRPRARAGASRRWPRAGPGRRWRPAPGTRRLVPPRPPSSVCADGPSHATPSSRGLLWTP